MADLKARIGERASTGNGMRFERGHVSPSDAVGSKSLLSRMGLDLGNAEIETVHESASPSGPHPSTQSDSLIRRLAIPAPSVRDSMSSATRSSSVSVAIFYGPFRLPHLLSKMMQPVKRHERTPVFPNCLPHLILCDQEWRP